MSNRLDDFSAAVHWWTVLTAILTFVLLCSGGLVTSRQVREWPSQIGQTAWIQYVFVPISRWVGESFTNTRIALSPPIGLMTVVLAVWLWRAEPRRWVVIFEFALFLGCAAARAPGRIAGRPH